MPQCGKCDGVFPFREDAESDYCENCESLEMVLSDEVSDGRAAIKLTVGELIDRATIIKLKMMFKSVDRYVGEYVEVMEAISEALPGDKDLVKRVVDSVMDLSMTNMRMWFLEDDLRDTSSHEEHGKVAEVIAEVNDLRNKHKRTMDSYFGIGTATSEKIYATRPEEA